MGTMRPVDKGLAPGIYMTYQDAGPDLQAHLGDYCSYCERQIETYLAVEHIQPKSQGGQLNAWSNFLLACVNCNSSKGSNALTLTDYFWPDSDNTLRALEYIRGGIIRPNSAQPPPIQAKAQATILLTGLDKRPGNVGREPTKADLRWLKRQQLWKMAELDQQRLTTNDSPEVRELIVENALGRGMFSIWWTIFEGDVDMRLRLREAFAGTDGGCFDANEDLVHRPGGQI